MSEMIVNGKRVVGSSEAARILSNRAGRTYSRDTVYKRYVSGELKPAVENIAGNLYYVEDIETLPINPKKGRPGKLA